GANAVDMRVTLCGGKPGHIARRIVVMDETEVKLGAGPKFKFFQRREKSVVGARFRHWQMEELNRPFHPGHDGIDDLDHDAGVLWLHHVFVGGTAVTKVIAKV